MIVECPNCSLEQPLDQYCAGCGKQLDKLIDEKNKKISARIKRTNAIIFSMAFVFLVGSFLYYASLPQPQDLTSGNEALENAQKRLKLPKAKIKGDKPKLKPYKAYAVAETTKKKKAAPKKRKPKVKKAAPVVEEESLFSNSKKVGTFYFLSLENCSSDFETGELNKKDLKSLLACAKVHLKNNKSEFEDVLEDGVSFATQVTIKVDEFLIEVGFDLTTDTYTEEFKQTLPLDIEDSSIATLWASTGHDIESNDPPDEEMLASYATSVLFNFIGPQGPPPKLYFLATYK